HAPAARPPPPSPPRRSSDLLVPAAAGTARLAELAGGAEPTAANARFLAAPIPVVLHILAVIPFSILGAFQFAPAFRRRRRGWHRDRKSTCLNSSHVKISYAV